MVPVLLLYLSKLGKTPVKVNHLALDLCGEDRSSPAENIEFIRRRNYHELVEEWVKHHEKFDYRVFTVCKPSLCG
jgi:hypothetical protein